VINDTKYNGIAYYLLLAVEEFLKETPWFLCNFVLLASVFLLLRNARTHYPSYLITLPKYYKEINRIRKFIGISSI